MKRAAYFLLFFILLSHRLSAADVTVTGTAATNGNANGELFIQINSNITGFPLNLVIVYPNGFNLNQSLTNYTYQLTGLPAGIYTVQVKNASTCILSLDIEIPDCKLLSGTTSYLCTMKPEVCCKGLFLTGGEDGFDSNTKPEKMSFNAYRSISPDQFNLIATAVHQKALVVAKEVLTYGITPYDVSEQNELETTAPLVMKFDETGALVWVWHNYSTKNDSEYRSSMELLPNSGTSSSSGFQVFPNPAQGSLNCNVDAPKEGVIKLELTTPFGQKLLSQSQYVSGAGSVTLKIRGIENIPTGLYFLKLINIDSIEKVQRVVLGNKY